MACYDQAIALIKEAIQKEPDNGSYLGLYSEILERTGDFKSAIQMADQAAELQPTWEAALRSCMLMSRDIGDIKEAYDYSKQQIQKYPQDYISRVWSARLAAMNGVPDSAQLIDKAGSLTYDEKWVPQDDDVFKSPDKDDPWWRAVEYGDAAAMRGMISPANILKRTSKYSQTALIIAACEGYEQIAQDLIKAGADIEAKDANNDTALHYAAQFKNPRLVKLLLEAGANPNLKDKFGETPLIKCSYNGNWQGMILLLNHKADPNMAQNKWGTPLHFAAGHADIDAVDLLISKGADVNARDRTGATPIIVAMKWYGHPFIISPLLAAGADINAKDKDGRTVLHHAINPQLDTPAIDYLLEKGADPTIQDNFGTTPITQARALGFEDVARKLESKARKTEPFVFPQLSAPDSSLTPDQVRASYFIVPILMAQGHPLGRFTQLPINEKSDARDELKNNFGIDNAKDLKTKLQSMESFQPSMRDEAGDIQLPEGTAYTTYLTMLKTAAEKVHASVNPSNLDESAWVKSHILYLADLGITAGYLTPEEATPLITSTSAELAKKYSSWKDFMASFLIGAKFHNAWEYGRYKNIAELISTAAPAWM